MSPPAHSASASASVSVSVSGSVSSMSALDAEMARAASGPDPLQPPHSHSHSQSEPAVAASVDDSSDSEAEAEVDIDSASPAQPSEPIAAPSQPQQSAAPAVPPSSSSSSFTRVWQRWPGANRFFCDGRLIAGPNPIAVLITSALIIIPGILFLAFPASDLADRSPGIYVPIVGALLLFFSLYFMYWTSFFDPGIIPRAIPLPGPEALDNPFAIKPRIQEHLVHGKIVQLKYCETCNIYRPPRAVHCGLCDNCVLTFDHHCPWIGTCVGAGNYRTFCIFLYFLSAFDIWVILFSIWDIVVISQEFQSSDSSLSGPEAFEKAMRRNPISFILAVFATLGSTFVLSLTAYHTFLIATGQTTNEQLKKSFPRGSPFHHGFLRNVRQLFCVLPVKSNVPNLREIVSQMDENTKGKVPLGAKYAPGKVETHDVAEFYQILQTTKRKECAQQELKHKEKQSETEEKTNEETKEQIENQI